MRYFIKEFEKLKECVVFKIDDEGMGAVVFHRATEDRKEQCINYKRKMEEIHARKRLH